MMMINENRRRDIEPRLVSRRLITSFYATINAASTASILKSAL